MRLIYICIISIYYTHTHYTLLIYRYSCKRFPWVVASPRNHAYVYATHIHMHNFNILYTHTIHCWYIDIPASALSHNFSLCPSLWNTLNLTQFGHRCGQQRRFRNPHLRPPTSGVLTRPAAHKCCHWPCPYYKICITNGLTYYNYSLQPHVVQLIIPMSCAFSQKSCSTSTRHFQQGTRGRSQAPPTLASLPPSRARSGTLRSKNDK